MLERTRLIDNIISEIKNKIIQGELNDGDMLASQDELAKTMGVSRASLREALNRLELMGLIESQQGRGTFVRTIAHTDFMNPLSSFLIMDKESAVDLLEARGYIEGAVAALAANNASEDDLEKLEQVLKRMEQACSSEDLKNFIAMDVQFHMLVAECSKNRIMAKIGEIIRDLLRQLINKFFETVASSVSDTMSHTIMLHRNVYEAIRRRDARSARRHMEIHIMDVKERILKSQNW
jgi:GntR family transcriptional repressor for pyruvate dehydrogenase complex